MGVLNEDSGDGGPGYVLHFNTQTEDSSSSGCDDSELPDIDSCKNIKEKE